MDNRTVAAAQAYRGIRNNNPGNMRDDGEAWQGKVGDDADGFMIFADDTWGIRALAKDITSAITRDGNNTITLLITAYAPPSENNTQAYINSVAADSGIDANEVLGTDADTLASLIRAITNEENGDGPSAQFISDADIAAGIEMAGNPATVFRPRQ